jgi:hypothetical protein
LIRQSEIFAYLKGKLQTGIEVAALKIADRLEIYIESVGEVRATQATLSTKHYDPIVQLNSTPRD